jgi:hypothetical protein
MKAITTVSALALLAATASAAPLYPTIAGYDFAIGSYNLQLPEFLTNGIAPDTLTYSPGAEHEVTTFWPNWPMPPGYPVMDLGGAFGADFELSVKFTGQDAVSGSGPSVSLTGSGANTTGADLVIRGTIPGSLYASGSLWELELDTVSLYGNAGGSNYVVEGLGTIVGGTVALQDGLIGQRGALRGHLDFIGTPAGWVPSLYDPTSAVDYTIRAAFSGETGLVPEPAALGLAILGVGLFRRR